MTHPLLGRFMSGPALIAPESRGWFEASLRAAAEHPRMADMLDASATADDGFWPPADDWRAAYRPYVVRDGILQVPVKGVLLHDFSFALGGFATGYAYIRRAFQRGMADATVRGILLVCDTPGGHVAGNFDLVDEMFAARGGKPIVAIASESAYSAGYSIASVADRVVVTRTGGVGSVGVMAAHIDVSAAMEQAGVKITFIYAGKHKVDGNAFEALPEDVKARLQSRIDELYATFVSTVARNRGLDEQAVRDTEALCFTATEAIANGFADTIGTLDDAVTAFAADSNLPDDGDETMSKPEDHEAAIASARADGEKSGQTTGSAEGKAAERARIGAIMGCDEAQGRESLARHFAFSTDMDAEAAKAALAASPKAAPAEAKEPNRLEQAMDTQKNPQIGADAPAGGEEGAEDPTSRILTNYRAATGAKPKAA